MSKEIRQIAARGLTRSNVGSQLVLESGTFVIEDVKYGDGITLVKVNDYLRFPNLKEIAIVD